MSGLPTRPLGASGLQTSVVGLGANNFGRRIDREATRTVVDAALQEGVTFIDTADIYGRGASEEILGEVLQGRRDEVVLASKFGMDMGDGKGPRGSRRYILDAVDASLARLRSDHLDYYWYHQPDGRPERVQPARTRRRDRRSAGLRAPWTRLRPVYPLASGLLTGKYRRGQPGPPGARLSDRDEIATDEQFAIVAELQAYARSRDLTLLKVAVGALLARDVVSSVIAGATRPEQVRANAAAARWHPTPADIEALAAVLGAAPA